MNKWIRVTALAAAGVAALAGWNGLSQPTERAAYAAQADDEPELSKKIVPIVTFGSNLNVGVAQVEGTRHRVGDVKAVAQIETDYKDAARVKILVPISTEKVIQNVKRVPQVSITAVGDVRLSD